jgi:hypothetical protein
MIYGEIAIHPQVLVENLELERLSLLYARFGFNKGALISKIPKDIYAKYRDAMKEKYIDGTSVDSVEVEEMLKELENAFISFGRETPKPPKEWIERILEQHKTDAFKAIVLTNEQMKASKYPDEVVEMWNLTKQLVDLGEDSEIARIPSQWIKAIEPLLKDSPFIKFIDPYIGMSDSKNKYHEFFREVIKFYSQPNSGQVTIQFYPVFQERNDIDKEKDEFEVFFTSLPWPPNVELEIFWWDPVGEHERAIVSEKGGVILDYGFQQPHDWFKKEKPVLLTVVKTDKKLNYLLNKYDQWEGDCKDSFGVSTEGVCTRKLT